VKSAHLAQTVRNTPEVGIVEPDTDLQMREGRAGIHATLYRVTANGSALTGANRTR
jgi:hypothetical protein